MNEPTDCVRASVRPGHEYHLASVVEAMWCEGCLLPSVLVARMILVDRLRPDVWIGVALHHYCRECGDERYTPGSF